MKKLIFIQLFIALLLSSCLVGKKYTRPDVKVPDIYLSGDSVAVLSGTASDFAAKDTTLNLQWFELFGDTVLNNLISQALDTNTNLKIAVLRVQQSRSAYSNSKASQWPSIGYSASASINDPADDNFNLLGTASWEIDFWGKIRHAKRAAYAEMLASEEGLKTVKTTLVSDVASLYFYMRDLDNRISVAEQTIASRKLYYDMVNERFLKGESAELDKLQAEQQVATAEATLSALLRDFRNTIRSPGDYPPDLPHSRPGCGRCADAIASRWSRHPPCPPPPAALGRAQWAVSQIPPATAISVPSWLARTWTAEPAPAYTESAFPDQISLRRPTSRKVVPSTWMSTLPVITT